MQAIFREAPSTYNICFEICFHAKFISLDDLLYLSVEINIED
jgi:hypothetical protein